MADELREIKLGVHGIVLHVDYFNGGGSIEHDVLYEVCSFCNQKDCVYDCDESTAVWSDGKDNEKKETTLAVSERIAFNGGVDAIMSFVLAAANAGIHVETPYFLEAIKTTLDAIGNND